MQCENPSISCLAECPLTGPFCCKCSCIGGPVCQGDDETTPLSIMSSASGGSITQSKLQAKFTDIPQDMAGKPSPSSVVTCAEYPIFENAPACRLFSSPLPQSEPDYTHQVLRDTPHDDSSSPSINPSTPHQSYIPGPIPPPKLIQRPIHHRHEDGSNTYDDAEAHIRRKHQRVALPSNNSLPVGYIQSPFIVPEFDDFVLPMSCDEFGNTRSIKRNSKLHDLIRQRPPGSETSITREQLALAAAIQAPPSQQVVPVQTEQYRYGQGSSTSNTTCEQPIRLGSFGMRYRLPETVRNMVKITTAEECLQIVSYAINVHGVQYAKEGRKERRREIKEYPHQLFSRMRRQGRIEKLNGAKDEGDKFGLEKEREVRQVVRHLIAKHFRNLPFTQEALTMSVPFRELLKFCRVPVPFQSEPLQVTEKDIPAEASILVFPPVQANTPAELETWMQKIQQVVERNFVPKRRSAVRKKLQEAKHKLLAERQKTTPVTDGEKRVLRNKIDTAMKALQREDMKATLQFTFEMFVKFGFS